MSSNAMKVLKYFKKYIVERQGLEMVETNV